MDNIALQVLRRKLNILNNPDDEEEEKKEPNKCRVCLQKTVGIVLFDILFILFIMSQETTDASHLATLNMTTRFTK